MLASLSAPKLTRTPGQLVEEPLEESSQCPKGQPSTRRVGTSGPAASRVAAFLQGLSGNRQGFDVTGGSRPGQTGQHGLIGDFQPGS